VDERPDEETLQFTEVAKNEYMIEPEYRYSDRHFFADEELKKEGADDHFAL